MADTDTFKLEFTGVHVQAPNCALVTAEVEEFIDKKIDHTYAYLFYDGKWYMLKQWPNAVVSMAHVSNGPTQLFFLTSNGKVYRRAAGVITEEVVDTSEEGPSDLLLMRRLIAVGTDLFAVGMARRAYRRDAQGTWSPIDDSCFVRRRQRNSATGFNDVAACGAELLAVGYKGEIWSFDGGSWRMDQSPANVTLTCLTPLDSERFVVAGLGGLLMLGKRGTWRVINQTQTSGDFWGAATLQGEVFLSTRDGVFRFAEDDLQRVTLDEVRSPSTAYLSATPGALWSVGPGDIYSSPDGKAWTKMENP
jgi:hypothetical protein